LLYNTAKTLSEKENFMGEAWMAFVSIISIVGIVLIAAGLIAFIGHMIIGAFDNNRGVSKNNSKEMIDYSQYKQIEGGAYGSNKKEYDFEAIDEAKAEKEKAEVEKEEISEEVFKIEEEKVEEPIKVEEVKAEVKEEVVEEEDDDFDIDDLLDEISNDVIEEEKTQADNDVKMSEELASFNIDEELNRAKTQEELAEDLDDEMEEIEESVKVAPAEDKSNEEIEALKAQLADLNRQLEEARSAKVSVVTIDMTEEECENKLAMLEERLKDVKKDYKINMKEYRPLKKVMNDLERYQTKLRRKEAIVAKKKVALYGVNNYVDIDKEKAEKLANELELLDGLRLSVNHCEEVINANKDRFPILEHTNQILEGQIAHIESDIADTQATLQRIRDKKGNGESENQ